MSSPLPHVCVCICTFRRPEMLRRLLEKLVDQESQGRFDYSVVVADNDPEASAREVAAQFAAAGSLKVNYVPVPVPNIARARNAAVANATGDFLTFIDDDEFPVRDWLLRLFETCQPREIAGALGPVLPHFDSPPPRWLVKAGFYHRTRHRTGFVLNWQQSRTGNVMIRRRILEGVSEVFREQFGHGGEDLDFFRRMMEQGHTFVWCDEAPVYESVPPQRWKRRFLLQRALLRGRTTLLHPRDRLRNVAKSTLAIPLYTLALPFLLLVGHHHFMRYLVRLFDHAGRLLALFHLNPVKERCH